MSRKTGRKPWEGRKAVRAALLGPPQATSVRCLYATMDWLVERDIVDIAFPGTRLDDVPGGIPIIGSWEGVPVVEQSLPPGIAAFAYGKSLKHVRLEDGLVHDGLLEDCEDGVCVVTRIMSE